MGQEENINSAMVKLLSPDKYIDIDVSVGIVANKQGELLIAKRPAHWMGGGYWEFPGGKIELEEDSESALKRELMEEVGIVAKECSRLINLSYTYPERTVRLNAWLVHSYEGEASGLEGQEISWCSPLKLNEVNMLPANRAIVTATQLPDSYLITPECHDTTVFLASLEKLFTNQNIKLMQLRSKQLSKDAYTKLANAVSILCRANNVLLLLNTDDLNLVAEIDCDGIHLRADQLLALAKRPFPQTKWVSASCHNEFEIKQASSLGLDFITISPVNPTSKQEQHLGWAQFGKLVAVANLPVYALGGMSLSDIAMAKEYVAQGIAASSSFLVR